MISGTLTDNTGAVLPVTVTADDLRRSSSREMQVAGDGNRAASSRCRQAS